MLPALLVPIATGALSALISGSGMSTYGQINRPPLSPPSWVFPVVWTVLYLMMGYAAYLIMSSKSYDKDAALRAYYIQLGINFLWPIVFFRLQMYTVAAFVLVALIAVVIVTALRFLKIDRKAGLLLLPYLAWLIFALYLNIGVAVLN